MVLTKSGDTILKPYKTRILGEKKKLALIQDINKSLSAARHVNDEGLSLVEQRLSSSLKEKKSEDPTSF